MTHLEVDPHTHSIMSLHSYSTVEECALHAAAAGLHGFVVTDHCSLSMAQRENSVEAIGNQRILPEEQGHLAFEDRPDRLNPSVTGAQALLPGLDFVIASVHLPFGSDRGTPERNAAMYCAVLRNPYVDVLGHTGRSGYVYELEPVLLEAKRLGKAIEINSSSLENSPGSRKPCLEIARACRDLRVPITVSSDAHSAFQIGRFGEALRLLGDLQFPEELIVNRTRESFENFVSARHSRISLFLKI